MSEQKVNEQKVQEFYNELKVLGKFLEDKENELQSYLDSSEVNRSEFQYQLRQLQKQDAPSVEFGYDRYSDFCHHITLKNGFSHDWLKINDSLLWSFVGRICVKQANKFAFNKTPYIFELEYRFYPEKDYGNTDAEWKTLKLLPTGVPLPLAGVFTKSRLEDECKSYPDDTYRLEVRFYAYLLN